ncbi:MAG: NAD-dependent epimerase/dehydratase family protein [Actinomycetaceae bacterium]|nr:NAD-dependent epimerase/dehydratase family protein [Actinomycetaceae bacterium]
MTLLVTGAKGFLGRHLQLYLRAHDISHVVADRDEWPDLANYTRDCTQVIHLAGVNRGTDTEVENGNSQLARDLINAFGDQTPECLVFANTIHADRDDPYGRGKSNSATILKHWLESQGKKFVDVRLPNLFGEGGRPFYNSFVASFIELVVTGGTPQINEATVPLLHAQDAAKTLFDSLTSSDSLIAPAGTPRTVQQVWDMLVRMHADYEQGTIPVLESKFEVNLFNSLRARMFTDRPFITLVPHADNRGHFVETARVRSGGGQTSFSTTVPGITRGQHYHLRKIERFVVMAGEGTMRLRHVLDDKIVEIVGTGDNPIAVDMPTGWAHSITNTGSETLLTQFWINELYNPSDPDTFAQEV